MNIASQNIYNYKYKFQNYIRILKRNPSAKHCTRKEILFWQFHNVCLLNTAPQYDFELYQHRENTNSKSLSTCVHRSHYLAEVTLSAPYTRIGPILCNWAPMRKQPYQIWTDSHSVNCTLFSEKVLGGCL